MVVVLVLLTDPSVLDCRKGGSSIAAGVAVRYWLRSPGLGVEDTSVRGVKETVIERWSSGPLAESVASVGSDLLEDVGTNIPTPKGVEVPVGLNGGEFGVVIVEVGVGGADEVIGDGVTEENGEDAVLNGVGFVLVEGDEDEGILHEIGVIQEGGKEGLEPLSGNGDRGIMSIRGHVGG